MRALLVRLGRLLDEPVMGLLALVALFVALAPAVFSLEPRAEAALDVLEWTILGVFALEYVVDLLLSRDRRAYVLSAWRLLDLLILAMPLLTLVLPAGEALRASPVLRLVRFARVLVFGARLRGRFAADAAAGPPPPPPAPRRVTVLHRDEPPREASWEETLAGVADVTDEWLEASGLAVDDFAALAARLDLPPALLSSMLAETAYPRIEVFARTTLLFLWLPALSADGERLERRGLVLAVNDRTLVTAARTPLDLQNGVADDLAGTAIPMAPFTARAVFGVLRRALRAYEAVSGQLERHLRALEATPVRESRPEFLERTFRLQQHLSTLKSDLWRLKGILGAVGEGRLTLHGVPSTALEFVRVLADDAGYAYETVFNAREGLLSLIELHLNVVSFEMNKVMRILAVLSALGLVPAVAGGLFGMNLADNPWPLTLAQVSFLISAVMSVLLYVFAVKGWLR